MKLHTATAVVAALFLASCMFGHTVALRLLLLLSGIALCALVIARHRETLRALPPVWLPFLLWGAWALLSLAWSVEPARTLKEWRNEVFYAGAGLWICYVGAQAREATRYFVPIAAAAALFACIAAFWTFTTGIQAYEHGWHGGPGDHSSTLLTLMPCAAMAGWYAARSGRPWIAYAAFALAGVFVASAYTTLNRTIWLGFAVQFVLLGGMLLPRMRLHAVPRRAAWPATLAALVIVFGISGVLLKIQAEREAIGAAPALERDHRLALWPQIGAHIAERPLLGYGFGRGLLREPLQKELKSRDTHLWHAHNLFLEALVQVGLPGLLLLIALLFALAREGWRRARDPDDALAACGIALLAVLAGMLVRNMTDTLLVRQNALLFWGVSGALMALGMKRWQASS